MREKPIGLPITIIVGGEYDKNGGRILDGARVDIKRRILQKALDLFGGATLTQTYGVWAEGGETIEEEGFQIIVYIRRKDRKDRTVRLRVEKFVRFVLSVSRQASILVDDNNTGEAVLVSADSLDEDVTAHG